MLFGVGLMISGMTQPAKVLGFLDIFGDWDPSLAVTVIAALAVSAVGFALARRRLRPVFAPTQQVWPDKTAIDRPLIVGSVLFGAGWGLVGLCPGPALVDLASGSLRLIVFVLAMAIGMMAPERLAALADPTSVATGDG